uniref:Uncharacterized protein n=1 Tax=Picea glauca TaxID=3330 RepID=A0A101LWX4_PICGL|nr:hypothetical protein ABT39_MTgene1358 [Picea glauca]QHR89489.1 hypothetical protein Q903MT_gene3510 [Picea sitchensis]
MSMLMATSEGNMFVIQGFIKNRVPQLYINIRQESLIEIHLNTYSCRQRIMSF